MRTTHGLRGSGAPKNPTYNSWRAMKQRCYNPNHVSYENYKHVTVCSRWLKSFECFLADMGEKPTKRHQIDRIDPYGDYEPENCRWSLPGEGLTRKQADALVEQAEALVGNVWDHE